MNLLWPGTPRLRHNICRAWVVVGVRLYGLVCHESEIKKQTRFALTTVIGSSTMLF